MKNSYIIAIVVVLVLAAGILFATGMGNKAESPVIDNMVPEDMLPLDNEADSSPESVKEFTVSGENFKFDPSEMRVKQGDKVKITFKNSQGFHDFKIDEYGVASKKTNAPAEEVLEFTADKAGSFEYYCSVGEHKAMGMKGTLIVE